MKVASAEDVLALLGAVEDLPREDFDRAVLSVHTHVCPVYLQEQWCAWRTHPLGWIASRRPSTSGTAVLRAALARIEPETPPVRPPVEPLACPNCGGTSWGGGTDADPRPWCNQCFEPQPGWSS